VRKLTGDDETLNHPGELLSSLIAAVRSRSSGSDGSTYPKGYGSIGSVQIHFNPMLHVRDPAETVPSNEELPCVLLRSKIKSK
jgi:hypothetical protein